jgi:hypothetical protein
MTKFLKITIFLVSLLQIAACTPKPPYEIKSPCVSIDSDDPNFRNPCIRRPANVFRDIT